MGTAWEAREAGPCRYTDKIIQEKLGLILASHGIL